MGGLVTGFIGGMIGLALGRPRLLLVYWAAGSPANAAGTNILVSGLAAATGTWGHFREGRIDFQVLALMGIPTVLGAFIGGFFGGQVPQAALLIIVGITTTWYGYGLLTGRRRGGRRQSATNPGPSSAGCNSVASVTRPRVKVGRYLLEMGLGFVIGLFGGVVGLVLGQLRLPAMIDALGVDPRMAAGTNLAISAFAGLLGFIGHLLHLEIDWLVLAILGPTAILGSYLGAKQTGKISPQSLRRWMGGVMIATSLPIFWLAYTQL